MPTSESTDAEFREQLIRAGARTVLTFIVIVLASLYAAWPRKWVVVKKLLTRERRSVVKYSGAAPARAVTRALEAATHAPNHWLNEPWRFRILGPDTVQKVVKLNEAKREVFEGVPGWLMVSIVPTPGDEKWNAKALEDHAACAAAVQNFMVSLASEGCASKWMTGALGVAPAKLLEVVEAGADEHFMGVIFYGKPSVPTSSMPVPTRKTGLGAPVLTTLP